MPFQLSPGVNVTEIDLTTVIPAVATTDAAIGGVFKWGPVDKPQLVVSEAELANEYGKPDSDNAETWFTAANFLAYSNRLHVSRAHHSTGDNLRVNGYAVNGSNYIAVAANTNTGVGVGDVVATTVSGFDSESTVTVVDTSDVVLSAGDIAADVLPDSNAYSEGLFTSTSAINFVDGEAVTLASTGTLPTGIDPGETYYIRDITTTTFKLAEGAAGNTAVSGLTDASGSGTLTVTRSGSTRITVSSLFSASTGTYDFEIHDPRFSFNAIANTSAMDSDAVMSNHIVKNDDHYDSGIEDNFDAAVRFVARCPGALGNSLKVSVCDSEAAFTSDIQLVNTSITIAVGSNTATISSLNNAQEITDMTDLMTVGDLVKLGNSEIGVQYLEITAIGTPSGNTASINFAQALVTTENVTVAQNDNLTRLWGQWDVVEKAPGTSAYVAAQGNTAAKDEMHVVVIDEDGEISGTPNTILEVWQGLSRATDAKDVDGGNLYYKDVINQSSKYIWWANDSTTATSATALNVASSTATRPAIMSFAHGRDIPGEADTSNIGDILRAYDKFKSAEDYDISLVLGGKSIGINGVTVSNYIIDNICERRKDCVAFISPEKADVVRNASDITEDVVAFRNNLRSTSYAVLDSGYKYQYDKYNDIYRWIPLNGDVAGLCAYTDDSRDPWWSPAGFNRGNIKNVVKLAWNPKKGERDILYKNGVNPCVNFPGQGIVLFGDKTLLAKPSAFDRINVRRLFIVLEKAIATASKFTLFEFNDEFTRASFVNLVTPYLRDVQGRRGITDFTVVCDETNNTGEVIDRNEFVGDIYIKPARSINFIQLNFVAVRTGVEFSEVIGNF